MSDGFTLGPVYIRFFGIILMLGALAGAWLTAALAKQYNEEPETVWDMLVNLIVGGIIGARLWHILTPTNSAIDQGLTTSFYLTHPLDILAIWDGGLGVIGAIIGGAVALWFYTRKYQLNFSAWADLLAPGVALGQAIGRISDLFNQQIYGLPTELPWKIFIDTAHRLSSYESTAYYHPLFIYEVMLSGVNTAMLIWLGRHYADTLKQGDIFILYIFNYSLIRLGLEFLRLDVALIAGYNINQGFAAITAILAALLFYSRHHERK